MLTDIKTWNAYIDGTINKALDNKKILGFFLWLKKIWRERFCRKKND